MKHTLLATGLFLVASTANAAIIDFIDLTENTPGESVWNTLSITIASDLISMN